MASSPDPSKNSFTRRKILGWSGIGVIAGVTGYLGWPKNRTENSPALARSAATPPATVPSESSHSEPTLPAEAIGRDAFLPHLNSEFQLESPSLATACKLVEVSALSSLASQTTQYTSFSLLFAAPENFAAESQIYRLTHPRMKAMDLFLSPVGKPGERVYLEAVYTQRV